MLSPDDPRHGTTNGYTNLGCRCQPCRDAFAVYHLDYMRRHPDQQERHRVKARGRTASAGGRSRGRWQPKGYPFTVTLGRLHDRPHVPVAVRRANTVLAAVRAGTVRPVDLEAKFGFHDQTVRAALRLLELWGDVVLHRTPGGYVRSVSLPAPAAGGTLRP